jgi:hypothetical protein
MTTADEVLTPIFRAQLRTVHGLLLAANCTTVATGNIADATQHIRRAFEVVDTLLAMLEDAKS